MEAALAAEKAALAAEKAARIEREKAKAAAAEKAAAEAAQPRPPPPPPPPASGEAPLARRIAGAQARGLERGERPGSKPQGTIAGPAIAATARPAPEKPRPPPAAAAHPVAKAAVAAAKPATAVAAATAAKPAVAAARPSLRRWRTRSRRRPWPRRSRRPWRSKPAAVAAAKPAAVAEAGGRSLHSFRNSIRDRFRNSFLNSFCKSQAGGHPLLLRDSCRQGHGSCQARGRRQSFLETSAITACGRCCCCDIDGIGDHAATSRPSVVVSPSGACRSGRGGRKGSCPRGETEKGGHH